MYRVKGGGRKLKDAERAKGGVFPYLYRASSLGVPCTRSQIFGCCKLSEIHKTDSRFSSLLTKSKTNLEAKFWHFCTWGMFMAPGLGPKISQEGF